MDRNAPTRAIHQRRTLALGLLGLILTAVLLAVGEGAFPSRVPGSRFVLWMTLGVLLGFFLRAARRKLMFRGISWHEGLAFDTLFQGAILVNPQLPYPDVEREFLALHTRVAARELGPWFGIRVTSAFVIPLLLAACVGVLARQDVFAVVCLLAAVSMAVVRTIRAVPAKLGRVRGLSAVMMGAAGALGEGLCVTIAASLAFPDSGLWEGFLLYAVLLAAFELSPVPLGLGVLEFVCLVLPVIFPEGQFPGALMGFAYRLWRGLPAALLALFYLPRFKMVVRDLFDPELPVVLTRLRRRPSAAEGAEAGPLLSVVVPAYNEAGRLPGYLPSVIEYCGRREGGVEIVVVDDGSKDATAAYVESVQQVQPIVRLVRMGVNQGKGAAVRRGVAEARGRYILFADADGATPIQEADKLLAEALKGVDVVIGSRKAEGEEVYRERSWRRELAGTIFYRITNLLAVPHIADTQCGFKLFSRAAARSIFGNVTETGWAFDVQVLFLAQKLGYQIEEVAINWTSMEGSKIRSVDALHMFVALFRIRRQSAGLTGE